MNPYETDRLLAEYLLFHYGAAEEVLPWKFGPVEALGYAVRCVNECVDATRLNAQSRALDVGCAVGRSAFELARICQEVVGVDYSQRFVDAANSLVRDGELPYLRVDEGAIVTPLVAKAPAGIEEGRVRFLRGDAHALPEELGEFDVVLAANLIDRLGEPARFLAQLPGLVKTGGQLVISSPYTWLPEFTEREHWLGGFVGDGGPRTTLDGLTAALASEFTLVCTKELPFLIREHARKFQWSVAQASIWRRH